MAYESDIEKGGPKDADVRISISQVPSTLTLDLPDSSKQPRNSIQWSNPFKKEKGDIEAQTAEPESHLACPWSWRAPFSSLKQNLRRESSVRRGSLSGLNTPGRRRKCFRLCFYGFLACFLGASLVAFIWGALSLVVARRVPRLLIPQNGFATVTSQALAAQPAILKPSQINWPENLSGDITPVECHSHNDEWRRVPLYEALSVGCISVEADTWLQNGDLHIGHVMGALTMNRTLHSLYLDPLLEIFRRLNSTRQVDGSFRGIFDQKQSQSLSLLIDMKSEGHITWPVLLEQLQPFYDEGYLTIFNGTDLIKGALTVVGSGNTPFDLLKKNDSPRIVFYDAHIEQLRFNDEYNTTNTAWASGPLQDIIGRVNGKLLPKQKRMIRDQIAMANKKNLVARYWKTPAYPVAVRDHVWGYLMASGAGLLNVDQLLVATQRNWAWCTFLGVSVC